MKNRKNITTELKIIELKTIDIEGMLQKISKIARSNNRLLERMNKSMRNINLMLGKVGNNLNIFKKNGPNTYLNKVQIVPSDEKDSKSSGFNLNLGSRADIAISAFNLLIGTVEGAVSARNKYNTIIANVNKLGIRYSKAKELTDIGMVMAAEKGVKLEDVMQILVNKYKKEGLRGKRLLNVTRRTLDVKYVFYLSVSEAIEMEKNSSDELLDKTSYLTDNQDITVKEANKQVKGNLTLGKHPGYFNKRKVKRQKSSNAFTYSYQAKKFNTLNSLSETKSYVMPPRAFPLVYRDSNPKKYAKDMLNISAKPKKSIYPSSLTEGLSIPNNNLVGDIISNDINKMKTMMSSLPKISSYLGGYNLPALNAPNNSNIINNNNYNNIEININATGDVNTDALRNTVGTAVIDSIQQGTSFID